MNVNVKNYISVNDVVDYKKENVIYLKQKFKAAFNWGCILVKEDYHNIFLRIGATRI